MLRKKPLPILIAVSIVLAFSVWLITYSSLLVDSYPMILVIVIGILGMSIPFKESPPKVSCSSPEPYQDGLKGERGAS